MSPRSAVQCRLLVALLSSLCSCVALGSGLAPTPVATLRLIGAETEFFCYRASDDNRIGGFACELLQEMARRVGHRGGIEVYPLPRALAVAAVSSPVLIAPVARIAAREQQFGWQIEMFEEEFVLVARRNSTIDISSEAALHSLHIGAIRDGAGARMLRERGIYGVNLVAGDMVNARKLELGRIDAWVSTWNGILAAQRSAGMDPQQLRRGIVLGRVKICIASSANLDPAIAATWKAAFEDMRRDGTYDLLARQFHFIAPPGAGTRMPGRRVIRLR